MPTSEAMKFYMQAAVKKSGDKIIIIIMYYVECYANGQGQVLLN